MLLPVIIYEQTLMRPWTSSNRCDETGDGLPDQNSKRHEDYRLLPRVFPYQGSKATYNGDSEPEHGTRPPEYSPYLTLGHTALEYAQLVFDLIQPILMVGQQGAQPREVITYH